MGGTARHLSHYAGNTYNVENSSGNSEKDLTTKKDLTMGDIFDIRYKVDG